MLFVETGKDLETLALMRECSILILSINLGYNGDSHFKLLIKGNKPVSRRLFLMCIGLQYEDEGKGSG